MAWHTLLGNDASRRSRHSGGSRYDVTHHGVLPRRHRGERHGALAGVLSRPAGDGGPLRHHGRRGRLRARPCWASRCATAAWSTSVYPAATASSWSCSSTTARMPGRPRSHARGTPAPATSASTCPTRRACSWMPSRRGIARRSDRAQQIPIGPQQGRLGCLSHRSRRLPHRVVPASLVQRPGPAPGSTSLDKHPPDHVKGDHRP